MDATQAYSELAEAFGLQPPESLLQAAARIHSAPPCDATDCAAIMVLRTAGLVPPLQLEQLIRAARTLKQLRRPQLRLVNGRNK